MEDECRSSASAESGRFEYSPRRAWGAWLISIRTLVCTDLFDQVSHSTVPHVDNVPDSYQMDEDSIFPPLPLQNLLPLLISLLRLLLARLHKDVRYVRTVAGSQGGIRTTTQTALLRLTLLVCHQFCPKGSRLSNSRSLNG